jgi:hypothetical protein
MSAMGALALFVGMCCALQWRWFVSRATTSAVRTAAR